VLPASYEQKAIYVVQVPLESGVRLAAALRMRRFGKSRSGRMVAKRMAALRSIGGLIFADQSVAR
jgi:hypothetical protein